jgi:hypothetical protein
LEKLRKEGGSYNSSQYSREPRKRHRSNPQRTKYKSPRYKIKGYTNAETKINTGLNDSYNSRTRRKRKRINYPGYNKSYDSKKLNPKEELRRRKKSRDKKRKRKTKKYSNEDERILDNLIKDEGIDIENNDYGKRLRS